MLRINHLHRLSGIRRLRCQQTTVHRFSSSSDKADDFSNASAKDSNTAEWIPPNRPLHGDQDHSQLYQRQRDLDRAEEALFTVSEDDSEEEVLRRLEEALALEERLEQEKEKDFKEQDESTSIDWLASRRKALGTDTSKDKTSVAVVHHQLLSEQEVVHLLESGGGSDMEVMYDDQDYPRMGGATAMVLCTASNQFYVNAITKHLVDHLKERQLQDLGVLGAQLGKNFLHQANQNNWNVVDCKNYIVHVFDRQTRVALNLEDLWRGKDPLWSLDMSNEDAVEDYVAEYHVPADYGPNPEDIFGQSSISKLQRQQWLAPHRPVIPISEKLKDRRAGRRRRRQRMREERDY